MQAQFSAPDVPRQPVRGRSETLVRATMLALAGGWAGFWESGTRQLWSQGGYLHLAFAQSLAEDRGYGVGGRAVFGDASPLWVALLAGSHELLRGLTQNWLVTGKVLTTLTAVFFIAGLYRLAQGFLAGAGEAVRRMGPSAVVLVVVLSPFWGSEAFSGSEVLAAAGVACWGCALVAGRFTAAIGPRRLLAACLCAGCGPLLRPEMLFLSVCLAPFLFVRWVNTPLRFGRRVWIFFTGLLLAVGPGAGWLLYTVRKFGTALPNTLGAGAAAPGASVLGQGIARVAAGAPWLPAAVAGFTGWGIWQLAGWRRRRSAAGNARLSGFGEGLTKLDPGVWLPLAWAFLAGLYFLATHTAITPGEVLLLAPACTASVFAMGSLFRPRFLAGAAAVCAGYGLTLGLLYFWPTVPVERKREQVYADLAATVRRLPASQRVALAPVGEVLFLSGHPVADLGGTLDAAAQGFRWDPADGRRVWWAHGQGARLMLLDHAPEPGSIAVWSSDLPADPWRSGAGGNPVPQRLTLWRLPPSPTLPLPLALPDDGQ